MGDRSDSEAAYELLLLRFSSFSSLFSPPAHQDGGTPGRAGGADIKDQRNINDDVTVMANYACVS